jgi:DNA-binding NarL/FixJ family response regulator
MGSARLGGRVLAHPTSPSAAVSALFSLVTAALRVGASGFLVKDPPPAEIINAVHLVASGDAIISPSVTRTPR